MSWLDTLRPASFRGVSFGVSASSHGFGRHTVVHEIPKKEDGAYVEDMGRRDALQKALAQKGKGALVHPHYGEREVCVAGEVECSEGLEVGGRVAVFEIPFVEVGEQSTTPSATLHRPSLARSRAMHAAKSTSAWLTAALSLVSSEAKESTATALYNGITRVVGALYGDTAGLFDGSTKSSLPGVPDTAFLLSALDAGTVGEVAFRTLHDLADNARDDGVGLWEQVAALTQVPEVLPVTETADEAFASMGTSRQAIVENANLLHIALMEWCVVEMCLSCSLLMPESKKQAKGIRRQLIEAIDNALLTMRHEAGYMAYTHLRTTAVAALAHNAGLAPDVGQVTMHLHFPTFSVLYTATGKVALYEDFLRRNGIRHPAFVPLGEVEVLYA